MSLTLSFLLGHLVDALIGMIVFMILRFFNGGHHLKSADICILMSVSIVVIMPVIANLIHNHFEIDLYLKLISLSLFLLFAPYKKQSIRHSVLIKIILSIIMIIFAVFNIPTVIIIAVLFQSIDVIPIRKFRWEGRS